MPDLLFELFSEEIPARMQKKAADDLARLVTDGLKKNELPFGVVESHVTPRRVALMIADIPAAQKDVTEEKRGPRVGAPEQAVNGFLGSVGLTLDQVETMETKKGEFYVARINRKGRPSSEILSDVLLEALRAFPWPKSMRWGAEKQAWVRPLHRMIALFDGAVVPLEFAGRTAGNETEGHRFLAPAAFAVTDKADYMAKLEKASVMLDREKRKEVILKDALRLAEESGLTLIDDAGLLEEVAGLVEWPVPLLGSFDESFLDLPEEVLVTSIKSHQKYFCLRGKDGKLAPNFVVVSNMVTPDKGKAIVAGNERVLRARLSDGCFFWDQDRKQTLADRVSGLENRIFHAKLGTDHERVLRMQKLADALVRFIAGADKDDVARATLLCKADLVTEMVGEFASLQGLMGRYYATNDGEKAAVATAIEEHYAPQGPSDACPSAPVSVAVALADKIDMLVGFWLIDEKPTGSKDPFALRRAALGVIRLLMENNVSLSLTDIFKLAASAYPVALSAKVDEAADDLLSFFADRLKVYLKEKGIRHDLIQAVFNMTRREDDIVRLLARVKALQAFLETDDGANLLIAYRRAANIVRIEEKKAKESYQDTPDQALFDQPEETALFDSLKDVQSSSATEIAEDRFEDAMASLARLRAPVDAFFDRVTVNCDDERKRVNRLKLLSRIGEAMGGVANFSEIES